MLAQARASLNRLAPHQAHAAVRQGGLMIDIRPEAQRRRDGAIPGARIVERNVLEWRCDPSSESSDPEIAADLDRQLIIVCDAGYQSSLAAATLQQFGFSAATDLIGGFRAWQDAGLPVSVDQER